MECKLKAYKVLKALIWTLFAIAMRPRSEIQLFREEREEGYSFFSQVFWTAYQIDAMLLIADVRSAIGLNVTSLIYMTEPRVNKWWYRLFIP